jgi:hydrogenase-4 component B
MEFPFYHTAALWLMLAGFAGGALLPLLLAGMVARIPSNRETLESVARIAGFSISFVASAAGCTLSLLVLLGGTPLHVDLYQSPLFGTVAIHVDALSAFFLGVISLVSAIVAVYSIGYTREYAGKRNVGLLIFLYNTFLLSMCGVVIAAHAMLFLFVWELMSLSTYFLIAFEHEDRASRRAAFLYAVMTHIGTALLVVMFATLYATTGSFSFASFRGAGARVPALLQSVLFLCATVGFGIKAGIIPFHIWLPEAPPAAPSNVSALMSGVMIKTGIYGMVRTYFDFLGPVIPEWWGVAILAIAVTSAVLGVLYALMEHDLKRLLAFHSIENIGIILMGVGGALLFASLGQKMLAAFALLAGLYHVANHATFKGLLFLGAGAVFQSTHSKNVEELGGLIKTMPLTALFFLVGAAAISALPPLNGFVSEWLTFQALLLGFPIADLATKIAVPLTVALLGLTGALAAACFVKAFGITFLGLPRSAHAAQAHEARGSMIAAMGALAVACIVLGVFPGSMVALLNPVIASLTGAVFSGEVGLDGGMLVLSKGTATGIAPEVLAGLLLLMVLLPVGGGVLVGGRLRRRVEMTWACGLEKVEPRMQYTATGLSKPIHIIFSTIYRARHEVEVSEESSPYFRAQVRYETKIESVFLRYFYEPVVTFLLRAVGFMQRLQTGRVQSYLAYLFIVLVILLLFAR